MPQFPVLTKLSTILERKVEKVRDEERNKRQDLHVLATSYCGQLKARSSQMIHESHFHLVSDKDKVSKSSEPAANDTGNTEKVTNGVASKEVNNGDNRPDKDSKDRRPSSNQTQ